jgi:hypothetical protein
MSGGRLISAARMKDLAGAEDEMDILGPRRMGWRQAAISGAAASDSGSAEARNMTKGELRQCSQEQPFIRNQASPDGRQASSCPHGKY